MLVGKLTPVSWSCMRTVLVFVELVVVVLPSVLRLVTTWLNLMVSPERRIPLLTVSKEFMG